MKIVGDMYERNERFVTDMLKAAKTMDKAMTESPAVPWVG